MLFSWWSTKWSDAEGRFKAQITSYVPLSSRMELILWNLCESLNGTNHTLKRGMNWNYLLHHAHAFNQRERVVHGLSWALNETNASLRFTQGWLKLTTNGTSQLTTDQWSFLPSTQRQPFLPDPFWAWLDWCCCIKLLFFWSEWTQLLYSIVCILQKNVKLYVLVSCSEHQYHKSLRLLRKGWSYG